MQDTTANAGAHLEAGERRDSHPRSKSVGYEIIRLMVGLILLIAGSLKAIGFSTDNTDIALFRPIWFQIGTVEYEWAIGLLLVSGLFPRLTRYIALVSFIAFAGVSLQKAVAGEASCGCFGVGVSVSPFYTLGVDLGCVLALSTFRPRGGVTDRSRPMNLTRLACFLMPMVWIGLPWAIMMASQPDTTLVIEPERWIGQCCPLLDYIDIGETLSEGRWTVVLYRHDCKTCQTEVPAYEERARFSGGTGPRIALIELPPYGRPAERITSADSPCALGRLSDSRKWAVKTPLVFQMEKCLVVRSPREFGGR